MKLKFKKINWLLIVLIMTLSAGGGCNNKEQNIDCGAEDPIKNLPWLAALKNNLNSNTSISVAEVVLYVQKNGQDNIYFFYVSKSIQDAFDLPAGIIYNCKGEILYSCGGNQPTDPCQDFFASAIFVKSLWKK